MYCIFTNTFIPLTFRCLSASACFSASLTMFSISSLLSPPDDWMTTANRKPLHQYKRPRNNLLTSPYSAVAGLKLLGGPNLHFYCSTLVFNIYFLEFAKLLGGPGPPRPLPTLRHCHTTLTKTKCILHVTVNSKCDKAVTYFVVLCLFLCLWQIHSQYHWHQCQRSLPPVVHHEGQEEFQPIP